MKISQFDPAIQLTGLESLVVAFNGANYKVSVGDVLAMVTKEYLGLEAVDNTRDMDKPISTATMTALAGKANFNHTHNLTISDIALLDLTLSNKSAVGHSHTEYATVAHSHSEYAPAIHGHSDYAASIHIHAIENVTNLQTALDNKANSIHAHTGYAAEIHSHDVYAPLDSPSLTGIPRAPTATAGDNSTQLATTAFVQTAAMLAGAVPDATTTVAGKVELATIPETVTGADNTLAVTPLGLASVTGPLAQRAEMNSRFDNVDTQFTALYNHVTIVRSGLEQIDADTTVYIEDTRDMLRTETITAIAGVNLSVTILTNNVNSEVTAVNSRITVLENTVDLNKATVGIDNVADLTSTLSIAAAGRLARFSSSGVKVLTVDSANNHTANQIYHVSNRSASGNLTITGAGGMILNPPKGGTLLLEPGDTVSLHVVSATEMDVYGSTLATV